MCRKRERQRQRETERERDRDRERERERERIGQIERVQARARKRDRERPHTPSWCLWAGSVSEAVVPVPVLCYTGRWSVEAMRVSVLETLPLVPPESAASPQAGVLGQCAVSQLVLAPSPLAVVWGVVLHRTAGSPLAAGEGAPLVLCRLLHPTRKHPPSMHRPLHKSHRVLF